jgi:penicillin G amidase
MRWAIRIGIALVTLVVVVAVAVYLGLRASLPTLEGDLPIAGLSQPVTVERDAAGVPTITGKTRLDVARALGFIHAQERFFQMDLLRRDAAGELSELFGQKAVAHDAQRRLHDLRTVAAAAVAGMTPTRRGQLEAYAAGVNAGLDELDARPFEYGLLRQAPARWTPVDSVLVIHAMWFVLSDEKGVRDEALGRMHATYPPSMYRFMAQQGTRFDAALDGSILPAVPPPTAVEFDLRTLLASHFEDESPSLGLDDEPVAIGSNSWAVTGQRAGRKGAVVANDIHLTARVPIIWYRARLKVTALEDPLDIVGVNLPGTPVIVVGSNGHIAWGFTNSYADVTDRVLVELSDADSTTYRTQDGDKAFTTRSETIRVAGGASQVVKFRDTVWGPVMRSGKALHAIRWTAQDSRAANVELIQFESARTVDEALKLVANIGVPPQNLVLGDSQGNIAWTVAGPIPKRLPDIDNTRVIDWRVMPTTQVELVPPADVPVIKNPKNGALFTANARIVGGRGLAVLGTANYALGPRGAQIRETLAKRAVHDEASLLKVGLDDRAVFMNGWRQLLERALAGPAADVDRADELKAVMSTWSGRALPDDAAFRWAREYRDTIRHFVLTPLAIPLAVNTGAVAFPGLRQLEGVVWTLLDERPMHLLHPKYKDWDALERAAVIRTLERVTKKFPGPLAERTWYERNAKPIAHPLTRAIPALSKLLNMPDRKIPGGAWVPRVMLGAQTASERIVVTPGRESKGLFHMPGGQSGHPLSNYYRTGFDDWVTGKKTPLLPAKTQHTLRLNPAG